MITITTLSNVVMRPDEVLGYEWIREPRTKLHPLIGSQLPAVTLRRAAGRSGTLRLFFLDKAEAIAAGELHATATLFRYLDTDHPQTAMHYAATGRVTTQQDTETMRRWLVLVEFQEAQAPTAFVPL